MELALAILALVLSVSTAVSTTLLVLYVRKQQRELNVDARLRHASQSKKVNTKLDGYQQAIDDVTTSAEELLAARETITELEARVEALELRLGSQDGVPSFSEAAARGFR